MISTKRLQDFDVKLQEYKIPDKLRSFKQPEYPTFILITAYDLFSDRTIISGSVPSLIFFAINLREGTFRGDLRRFKDNDLNFITFASILPPFVIIQLLYLFGYKIAGTVNPPVSNYGKYRTIWTMKSGKLVPNKTTIAIMKHLEQQGFDVNEDHRTFNTRTPSPYLSQSVAAGQYQKANIDFMLMKKKNLEIRLEEGEIFYEYHEGVRRMLTLRSSELTELVKNWYIDWCTIEGQKNIWKREMKPILGDIPERCLRSQMGANTNILVYYHREWFEYTNDESQDDTKYFLTDNENQQAIMNRITANVLSKVDDLYWEGMDRLTPHPVNMYGLGDCILAVERDAEGHLVTLTEEDMTRIETVTGLIKRAVIMEPDVDEEEGGGTVDGFSAKFARASYKYTDGDGSELATGKKSSLRKTVKYSSRDYTKRMQDLFDEMEKIDDTEERIKLLRKEKSDQEKQDKYQMVLRDLAKRRKIRELKKLEKSHH